MAEHEMQVTGRPFSDAWDLSCSCGAWETVVTFEAFAESTAKTPIQYMHREFAKHKEAPVTTDAQMRQYAPFPDALAELVEKFTDPRGWTARLLDRERDPADTHGYAAGGLTLIITTKTINSYPPHDQVRVNHYFIVPAATFVLEGWLRWFYDRFEDVGRHESMEFFTVDGKKPFAPNHGPGQNPYVVHEPTTDLARRTSFLGVVKDPEGQA